MTLVRRISIVALLCFGFQSHASQAAQTPPPQAKSRRVAPKPKKIEETHVTEAEEVTEPAVSADHSSSGARHSQRAMVEALYTPVSGFVLSYGAGGAYNLNPDLSVGFSLLMGDQTLNDSTNDGTSTVTSTAKLNGMAAYGYGRFFFGNSFNSTVGLGLRTASMKYTVEEASIGAKINGKIDIQSIVIPIFIGNRWTWDNGMTIGCDWVGVFVPISGSAKSSLDGNLSNDSIKTLNQSLVDSGDKLAHQPSWTLFLTSLGWAF